MNLSQALKDRQFCLLTTFKRSGEGVATPMWFCLDGETVYMTTRSLSWKVKRLRANPQVRIGWSNSSGKRHGKLISAHGVVLEDPEEIAKAKTLLAKKYGLKLKLANFVLRTFGKDKNEAIIRVEIPES